MNTEDSAQAAESPRLSRRMRLQYEPAQTRWVLLYPEGMVQLNDSAAEILRRCDGSKPVSTIIDELETLFSVQGIAPQVRSLIEEGTKRGWLD
ncbi:pyrroloquinoline quinone biosynthesis peptide chaperone PqqD [Comamonas badia]|uniref:pyrroloquinoline quinone biosynthesis peptide chaperone PqqD n=1 Tax=Comamonas badia TaxID=265291 RepID=UPI0004001F4D|nr:pyrroloquinoline quinone biosynthesis peptide chaperone PqqD [Comamonas badia]